MLGEDGVVTARIAQQGGGAHAQLPVTQCRVEAGEQAVVRGELAAMPPPRIVALPSDLVRHELFTPMTAASQETLVEIVDEIFLPLATNFGNNTQAED